jgi:hypothetical protein
LTRTDTTDFAVDLSDAFRNKLMKCHPTDSYQLIDGLFGRDPTVWRAGTAGAAASVRTPE